MSIRIKLSQDDLNRSKVVTPGWYLLDIIKIEQKKAKNDDSMNTVVEFRGKSGEAAGIPFQRYFSEKAPGFFKDFLEAITGEEVKADTEYELDGAVGETISAYIENGEYQGRTTNNVKDFRHVSKHRE